jgi:hypothetical protein
MVIRSAAGSPRMPVEQEIVRFAMLSCTARVRRMMGESIDRPIEQLKRGARSAGTRDRDELGREDEPTDHQGVSANSPNPSA